MISYYRATTKFLNSVYVIAAREIFQVSLVMKDLNNTHICINSTNYVLDY